jgi:DNA-binding response OmpR family regulator
MAAGSVAAPDEWRTVLVVEDDLPLLEVLGMLLEFEHFRCIPAADGLQALELLEDQRPALVILDWLIPKMSGPEVLAAIRERYGAKVPVLVLSAIADAEEARQAGADDYLRKPYAIEELVAAIRRLLQPR